MSVAMFSNTIQSMGSIFMNFFISSSRVKNVGCFLSENVSYLSHMKESIVLEKASYYDGSFLVPVRTMTNQQI